MTVLFQKIKTIYPEISLEDFHPISGTIRLEATEDGKERIMYWNHPTLARPTDEQLS